MSDEVSVRVENAVGRITLNRPDALHSLTTGMFQSIADAVSRWASDPSVSVVLVDHAEGSRGFCSGGDIRIFRDAGSSDPTESRHLFRVEYALNAAIARFPKPYIGILDGITMGGGAGITVHGSHRVATENTVFAMPETGIGLFPDVGAGFFLSRMPGSVGTWLGLTGARLKGSDVVAVRIATHFADSNCVSELKSRIIQSDYSNDPRGVVDRCIADFPKPAEDVSFEEHIACINRCFGFDRAEEIVAALEQERGDWARTQLESLRTKCPTSIKIGLRLIREGARHQTIADEMRSEFRIAWRRVAKRDLAEGVRAVVIDRSQDPVWSPRTLEEVSEQMIDEYFAPLGENELPV